MNSQTSTLRGLLAAMVATAVLPAATASAEDRRRIPLPPPPGEVIREVRGFIHGIGRGIKRGAKRVFNEPQQRSEREMPRPRRDYGPDDEWNGEFYPDELDQPGVRPQYRRPMPPREDERYEGWTSEEQLRREEAARQDARNYRPTPPDSRQQGQSRKEPSPEQQFRAPATPPSLDKERDKGATKDASSAPTTQKSATPSSDVQYGSPVPGKKGLVYPPGVEKKPENMVDVGDFQPGQLVRNPRTGELFRVP